MELFTLIIFSTSLFLFGANACILFGTMLIYSFLIIIYKTNINYLNNLDLMTVFIYQFNNFVKAINKTRYGSLIINFYNYLDSIIVQIKKLIFNWLVLIPGKFIMNKTIRTLLDSKIVKENSTNIKLETNIDISNFLDGLLNENKK